MQTFLLMEKDALNLTAADLVSHIQWRLNDVKPQTANNDLIWLRVIFRTARTAWNLPLDSKVVEAAADTCRRQRLVGRPSRRDRRPSIDELDVVLSYVTKEDARREIPSGEVVLFALFSSRRVSEITRLRWEDLDEKNSRILVRSMKQPTKKSANDRIVYLTQEAMAIIKRQPRTDDRIFPYRERSISSRFQAAVRFHDLRHECVSWLFEKGMDTPEWLASVGTRRGHHWSVTRT